MKKTLQSSKFIQNPLVFPYVRAVWNSAFIQFWRRSYGDFMYPVFLFRWTLVSWLTPRKKIRVDHVKFSLGCTNWITHFRWYLFKTKEPEVRYFFDTYLSPGDIVFDVGANIGVFSLYASSSNSEVIVYAIEPEITNLARLRENILANGLQKRVNPICAGVSDRVGLTQLYLSSEEAGSAVHSISDTELNTTHLGYEVVGTEDVFSITLDYLAAELNVTPNLIKIDTDGNEKKILQGASEILLDVELRAIVIEMPIDEEDASACREILRNVGFFNQAYPLESSLNEIWARK